GMSIWFGVRSSVCQMVIERLDGTYNETNEVGQYPLYNKVAGVVVTGNEDGAHASAETTLFNMTHLGCAIPPNADTYWVGEAGLAAAALVADPDGRPILGHVAVAPFAERHQNRIKIEPHLGEAVAVAGADLILVGLAPEDPGVDKPSQPLREKRAGDLEGRLE